MMKAGREVRLFLLFNNLSLNKKTIMKKLHLLLLALMLSVVGMAQTKLTTSTGSLSISNPNEGMVTTYPVDKLFFTLANNNVKIYLIGQGPAATNIVANNAPVSYLLNGASGTDTATVKTFLISNGVGRAPAGGGGGGGGGDASAANQATQIARETTIATNTGSIDSKTPTLGQKNSAGSSSIVVANDQSAIPVSATNLAPGASTSIRQDTMTNAINRVSTTLNAGALKSHVPGMFTFVTGTVQAVNSEVYNGPVGDAKVLFLQSKTTTTGTLRVQFSMDGVVWASIVTAQAQVANAQVGSITPLSTEIYKIPIQGDYVRLYVSTAFAAPVDFILKGAYDDRTYDLSTFNVAGAVTTTGTTAIAPTAATGVATYHKLISAATGNPTLVKSSAGNVNAIILSNTSATARYFKIFNMTTAPTLGTSVPTFTIYVPPTTTISLNISNLRLGLGISYAITANAADLDATAVAAGDIIVNINYI